MMFLTSKVKDALLSVSETAKFPNKVFSIWLIILGDSPSPNIYNIKSCFDQKTADHGRAYTFGIAREAYSRVKVITAKV